MDRKDKRFGMGILVKRFYLRRYDGGMVMDYYSYDREGGIARKSI